MRRLLIALLSLTLAGCWIGQALYADSDARTALAPGLYRISMQGEKPGDVRISVLPSGLTQMGDNNGSDVYGFAPLDPRRGTFVAWQGTSKGSIEGEQLYLLAQRHPDGSFAIYVPFCDGKEADIARAAGAAVEPKVSGSKSDACRFPTRASLESALRQVQPSDEKRVITLAPEGK